MQISLYSQLVDNNQNSAMLDFTRLVCYRITLDFSSSRQGRMEPAINLPYTEKTLL